MTANSVDVEVEGRRERRRRELHERVYEHARELFSEQGFEATTVEQIAAAADVAPATFFNHFQSKQNLFAQMTGEVVTFLEWLLEEHLRDSLELGAQLEGLATAAGGLIQEHHRIARDLVLEMIRSETRPGETAPYLARVHDPVANAIRLAQERGEVRADAEPVFLAEMVIGMLNATITQWLSDPDYPIAEQLPRAAAFAWDALRSPTEPKPA